MHLKLSSLADLEEVQLVLRLIRRRRLTIHWRIGPVREQAVAPLGPKRSYRFFNFADVQESPIMKVITDSQEFDASVTFKDKRGNPADVENVQFSSSDATVLEVTQDAADPKRAHVKAVGPLGTAQVNVVADAKLGPDAEAIIAGVLEVQVVAGEAVTADIATSEATEQP